MPMQNPERVVTKQDLKDFYNAIYPYLGGSFSDLIAHIEADATSASKAYAVGDQLILDNHLYNVIAAIAIDDPLTVGTNIALADDLTTQISEKMDSMTIDATPTASSDNLVKSGGVYSNTVTALSADTASTNGQVKINYTKAGANTDVSASVYGWNPLVGKWTSAVTALISATSVSLTNPFSTASVDVFPVCENSSGTPITVKTINATSSTITLTFDALTEDTSFKAIVKANV